MNTKLKFLLAACMIASLAACGGGGGADDESANGGTGTGNTGGGNTGGTPTVPVDSGSVDVSTVKMDAAVSCNIENFAQQLMEKINAARAVSRTCGTTVMPAVAPLQYWNTKLQAAAEKHSTDMAVNNFLSHTGSDGSTLIDRLASVGYVSGSGLVGENALMSPGFVYRADPIGNSMDTWLASEGHCKNIMSSDWDEMGAACVISQNGTAYITNDFSGTR